MHYNLSEEQSTKFYNDLTDAIDIIDRVHASGIEVLERWYDEYVENHSSIFGFKPMSIEKFGKKITLTKSIQITTDSEDKRYLHNADGWSANLRPKKIAKLIKKDYYDVLKDTGVVSAACVAYMCKYREYDEWVKMVHQIENFMTVPYTIDEEWLEVLESLPTNLYYYKTILRDDV